MVALLAESEVPPFHIPMSHQEVVSGYATEYGGPRLAMIELTHFVKLFVLISLFVALFIGGSFDILTFLTRSLGILFLVTLSSAVMARMRITGSLKLCWFFGLVALIDVARILLV
jgi:formate hydrogenlyase subunit 4